jgi:hypothetical protein
MKEPIQNLTLSQQVTLSDDLLDSPRTHPLCQGGIRLRAFPAPALFIKFIKKTRLVHFRKETPLLYCICKVNYSASKLKKYKGNIDI